MYTNMILLLTVLLSTPFVVIDAGRCIGDGGLLCEQASGWWFGNNCPSGFDGPLEKECKSNNGECVEIRDICHCIVPPGEQTSCVCQVDGTCNDNNCAAGHTEGAWKCAINTDDQCRCREQCELPQTALGAWTYCDPDDCDAQHECTSCQNYHDSSESARIDFYTCDPGNHCQWEDQLCVKPPCVPLPDKYKYCPREECTDCVPCRKKTEPIRVGTCVENCEFQNFPCIYKQCIRPTGYDWCEKDENLVDGNKCFNCKSCDQPSKPCDDFIKCRMNDGGRCVKTVAEGGPWKVIKGTADDAAELVWDYYKNEYVPEKYKNILKERPKGRCPINRKLDNLGDWAENMAEKEIKKWISDDDINRIYNATKDKSTVYEKLICVADYVKLTLDTDCVCRHHAWALYWILRTKFSDVISSVDMTVGMIKGDWVGHAIAVVKFTDEDGNQCTLLMDSYNSLYIMGGDCKKTTTPASTANTWDYFMKTWDLNCLFADNCQQKPKCKYHMVGLAKNAEESAVYCQKTYGTHLGTVKNGNDMSAAYLYMNGAPRVRIGLKNTHKSGWFVHSDGTSCEYPETGACVEQCMWKDRHPQKTCERHPGSWSVTLYDEGYIDNTEKEDVEMPFLCNCYETKY
eukprot:238477_1